MPTEQMFHHYLTCQELTFLDKDGDMGVARINAMIQSEGQNLTVRHLGRGQQAAQAQLHEKLGYVAQIVNVIFINIDYIGLMSSDEFQQTGVFAPAEGQS